MPPPQPKGPEGTQGPKGTCLAVAMASGLAPAAAVATPPLTQCFKCQGARPLAKLSMAALLLPDIGGVAARTNLVWFVIVSVRSSADPDP